MNYLFLKIAKKLLTKFRLDYLKEYDLKDLHKSK
jgi:hypothetical protein